LWAWGWAWDWDFAGLDVVRSVVGLLGTWISTDSMNRFFIFMPGLSQVGLDIRWGW